MADAEWPDRLDAGDEAALTMLGELNVAHSAAAELAAEVRKLQGQLRAQEAFCVETQAERAAERASMQDKIDSYRTAIASMEEDRLDTLGTLTSLAAENLLRDQEKYEVAQLRLELQQQRAEVEATRAFLMQQAGVSDAHALAASASTTPHLSPADIQVLQAHFADTQQHGLKEVERLLRGRVMHEQGAEAHRRARRNTPTPSRLRSPDPAALPSADGAWGAGRLYDGPGEGPGSAGGEALMLADACAQDPALQHLATVQRHMQQLQGYLSTADAATGVGKDDNLSGAGGYGGCAGAGGQRSHAPGVSMGGADSGLEPVPVVVIHLLREQQQALVSLVQQLALTGEGYAAKLATREQLLTEMQLQLVVLQEKVVSMTAIAEQVPRLEADLSQCQEVVREQQTLAAAQKTKTRQQLEALIKQNKVLRCQVKEKHTAYEAAMQDVASLTQQVAGEQQSAAQHAHAVQQQLRQTSSVNKHLAKRCKAQEAALQQLTSQLALSERSRMAALDQAQATAHDLLAVATTLEAEREAARALELQREGQFEDLQNDMRDQLHTVMEAYAEELHALHDQLARLEAAQAGAAQAPPPPSPTMQKAMHDQLVRLKAMPSGVGGLVDAAAGSGRAQVLSGALPASPVRYPNETGWGSQATERAAWPLQQAAHVQAQLCHIQQAEQQSVQQPAQQPAQQLMHDSGNALGPGNVSVSAHVLDAGGMLEQQLASALLQLKSKHQRLKTKYAKQGLRQHQLQQALLQMHGEEGLSDDQQQYQQQQQHDDQQQLDQQQQQEYQQQQKHQQQYGQQQYQKQQQLSQRHHQQLEVPEELALTLAHVQDMLTRLEIPYTTSSSLAIAQGVSTLNSPITTTNGTGAAHPQSSPRPQQQLQPQSPQAGSIPSQSQQVVPQWASPTAPQQPQQAAPHPQLQALPQRSRHVDVLYGESSFAFAGNGASQQPAQHARQEAMAAGGLQRGASSGAEADVEGQSERRQRGTVACRPARQQHNQGYGAGAGVQQIQRQQQERQQQVPHQTQEQLQQQQHNEQRQVQRQQEHQPRQQQPQEPRQQDVQPGQHAMSGWVWGSTSQPCSPTRQNKAPGGHASQSAIEGAALLSAAPQPRDGPLVPLEVLTHAAQYAGDEGLARPSSAVPSRLRPPAEGAPGDLAAPEEALQLAQQYTGAEGVARPSTATPSTLRPVGYGTERPVPVQVLHHAQRYAGEEGAARPPSAPPSVLRPQPVAGAQGAGPPGEAATQQHSVWPQSGGTIVVGRAPAPLTHPHQPHHHHYPPYQQLAAADGAVPSSSAPSTDGRLTVASDVESTNLDSAFGGFETPGGGYVDGGEGEEGMAVGMMVMEDSQGYDPGTGCETETSDDCLLPLNHDGVGCGGDWAGEGAWAEPGLDMTHDDSGR